jgi:hypothetical protein
MRWIIQRQTGNRRALGADVRVQTEGIFPIQVISLKDAAAKTEEIARTGGPDRIEDWQNHSRSVSHTEREKMPLRVPAGIEIRFSKTA